MGESPPSCMLQSGLMRGSVYSSERGHGQVWNVCSINILSLSEVYGIYSQYMRSYPSVVRARPRVSEATSKCGTSRDYYPSAVRSVEQYYPFAVRSW